MTGCFADGSGSAYCGSPLTAVSPDGQVAFTLPIQQPAVLRHDGIFVGAGSGKENAGKLVAVRRDGTTVWSSVPVGDVVVDGEDTAYVTSTMASPFTPSTPTETSAGRSTSKALRTWFSVASTSFTSSQARRSTRSVRSVAM
jgi:hypothetical protein